MEKKLKIYCFSALALMILVALLRTLALFFSYDTATGYFNTSFLSVFTGLAFVIGTAWCLSAVITIPRGKINTEFTPNKLFFKLASGYSAIAVIISSISIATQASTSLIETLSAVFATLSSLFFIFSVVCSRRLDTTRAFLSILSIISLVLVFASVYFEFTIAMNSPHKTLGSFAVMSAMIFMLCETRTYLARLDSSKAFPRLHFAFGLITVVLGLSLSISSAVYCLTSGEPHFVISTATLGNPGYIGVISAVSVYALARCFTFTEVSAGA